MTLTREVDPRYCVHVVTTPILLAMEGPSVEVFLTQPPVTVMWGVSVLDL